MSANCCYCQIEHTVAHPRHRWRMVGWSGIRVRWSHFAPVWLRGAKERVHPRREYSPRFGSTLVPWNREGDRIVPDCHCLFCLALSSFSLTRPFPSSSCSSSSSTSQALRWRRDRPLGKDWARGCLVRVVWRVGKGLRDACDQAPVGLLLCGDPGGTAQRTPSSTSNVVEICERCGRLGRVLERCGGGVGHKRRM